MPTIGHAGLDREVHDLADLLGCDLGDAAADHREVLGEDADRASFDLAEAGDDRIARILLLVNAEVSGAVQDQGVELLEAALISEHVDSLAGG